MVEYLHIIFFWILFAAVSGVTEAVLFSNNVILANSKKKEWQDEHFWFTTQRFIVYLILIRNLHLAECILLGLAFFAVFPFIHDGVYYTVRDIIYPGSYPKRFLDNSTETDAKLSFGDVARVSLFLIGVAIIIATIELHKIVEITK